MTLFHKYTLSLLLLFLGLSLIIPGMINMLRPSLEGDVIFAETISGKNHLRAVNAMIASIGFLAILACIDIVHSRQMVIGLGIILLFLAAARSYSIIIDGIPSYSFIIYLIIESIMATLFILWPPPK